MEKGSLSKECVHKNSKLTTYLHYYPFLAKKVPCPA